MKKVIFFIFFFCTVCSAAHPTPIYFQWLTSDGSLREEGTADWDDVVGGYVTHDFPYPNGYLYTDTGVNAFWEGTYLSAGGPGVHPVLDGSKSSISSFAVLPDSSTIRFSAFPIIPIMPSATSIWGSVMTFFGAYQISLLLISIFLAMSWGAGRNLMAIFGGKLP